MSARDVAAVDHLNSLHRPQKSGDKKNSVKNEMPLSSEKRSPFHTSLPTSPIKDGRSDGDTLRRAMARHQASLSRPASPPQSQNDDLPPRRHPSYSRLAPMSSPVLDRRTNVSHSMRGDGYRTSTSHIMRGDGYRTVATTGTTSSARMKTRDTPGLEGTKSSLRNSQTLLNKLNYKPPSANPHSSSDSSGSPDDSSNLSASSYPYLSNSTYSLPRNHRLYKSNRHFAASLRESQESLLSSSRESLVPETRESLLRRYPSSSLRSTPASSPDRYSERPSSRHGSVCSNKSRESSPNRLKSSQERFAYTLQTSFSQNSFPSEHSLHMDSEAAFQISSRKHNLRSSCDYDPPHSHLSSAKSSRNNSPLRRRTQGYFDTEPLVNRRSEPVSPAYSLRSSRAASPADSWSSGADISVLSRTLIKRRSSRVNSPTNSTFSRTNSQRSSRATSPALRIQSVSSESEREGIACLPPQDEYLRQHRAITKAGSVRSSRAASPAEKTTDANHKEITNIDSEIHDLVSHQESKANPIAKVIYVRETFKVVPVATKSSTPRQSIADGTKVVDTDVLAKCQLVEPGSEETLLGLNTPQDGACSGSGSHGEVILEEGEERNQLPKLERVDEDQMCNESLNQTDENKVYHRRLKSVDIDDQEDTRSVGTQESGSSNKIDKATTVDLSLEGINNIEELLESLSRRVRNVEQIDRDFERVENVVDNDDSARAESVVSLGSSASSRIREDEQEGVLGGENDSLIRRQSVIIEGLTLETEELRKKCQVMEEELVTPVVEDLSQKLEQVEEKLEETETYCYQVVEENVELKSEIEALESEISEVQDTFRDKDAKEFKKVKWELENLSKTCRNLQIKLGKAQAKASRLRQEKEEIEDEQREQREQTLWKTSAVAAVAALAAYQLLSRYK